MEMNTISKVCGEYWLGPDRSAALMSGYKIVESTMEEAWKECLNKLGQIGLIDSNGYSLVEVHNYLDVLREHFESIMRTGYDKECRANTMSLSRNRLSNKYPETLYMTVSSLLLSIYQRNLLRESSNLTNGVFYFQRTTNISSAISRAFLVDMEIYILGEQSIHKIQH